MKKHFLFILLLPLFSNGQEHVDILKIGFGQTFNNNFKNVDGSTDVKSLDVGLTLPIPINKNQVFITGVDFSYNNLQLFPETQFTSLYTTTLKIGMASNWSEKWSTTFILLPKLASDYEQISHADFFIGAIAIMKFKKSEKLLYRFGLYASQEAFGVFTTPILGLYYNSPNKKFEMDLSLPISANINYNLGATTLGLDYFGIGRSFNMHNETIHPRYADLSSLEASTYLQFNLLSENVLMRTKLGYSSNDYEVYAKDDKIDLGISALSLGDDRIQLNPSINGSIFVKIDLIYRFHLKKSSLKEKLPN